MSSCRRHLARTRLRRFGLSSEVQVGAEDFRRTRKAWWAYVARVRDFGIPIAVLIVFSYLSFVSPVFFTSRNLLNVLDQSAIVGMIAVAKHPALTLHEPPPTRSAHELEMAFAPPQHFLRMGGGRPTLRFSRLRRVQLFRKVFFPNERDAVFAVDAKDRRVGGFRQTVQVWAGSRVIRVLVELDDLEEPRADPWNSYYAARFAWPDETSDSLPFALLGLAGARRGPETRIILGGSARCLRWPRSSDAAGPRED